MTKEKYKPKKMSKGITFFFITIIVLMIILGIILRKYTWK